MPRNEKTIMLLAFVAIACFELLGYHIGKQAADRWWQEHQVKCEPPSASGDSAGVPTGSQPYTDISTQADLIIERLKVMDVFQKSDTDAVGIISDCARVDQQTWKKRRCQQRREQWDKHAAELERERDKLWSKP